MKKEKNTRGVTLIALVVTIIVLLILAVIGINSAIGENGLLKQAGETKLSQEEKIATGERKMDELKEEYANAMAEPSKAETDSGDGDNENPKRIWLDKKAITLEANAKETLVAILVNSDEEVKWESANPSVATVTPISKNEAEVSYVTDGFCAIYAKTSFGSVDCDIYCGDCTVGPKYTYSGKLPAGVELKLAGAVVNDPGDELRGIYFDFKCTTKLIADKYGLSDIAEKKGSTTWRVKLDIPVENYGDTVTFTVHKTTYTINLLDWMKDIEANPNKAKSEYEKYLVHNSLLAYSNYLSSIGE